MKDTGKWIVGLLLLVIIIVLLGFIVLFGGLALALLGFFILVAPIILDWSFIQRSNKLSIGASFIRPHARKYGLLMIVFGFGIAYLGIQIGDAMYQPPANTKVVQTKEVPKPQQEEKVIATPQPKKQVPPTYMVTNIIDGDTFEASVNGKNEKIRMLLIDTPETVHPNQPVQPFGREASEYTKQLLTGKKVTLEADKEDRDKYGRLLRYVYIDGKSVQEQLLEKGYARVSIYEPNTKYVAKYQQIESNVKKQKIAVWSVDNYVQASGFVVPKPKPVSKPVQKPTPKPVPKSKPKPEPKPQPEPKPEPKNETVYYKNCSAAKSAGAAPLHKGEPGYRSALDRDKDGVACE